MNGFVVIHRTRNKSNIYYNYITLPLNICRYNFLTQEALVGFAVVQVLFVYSWFI
jgi:hypothetical protein